MSAGHVGSTSCRWCPSRRATHWKHKITSACQAAGNFEAGLTCQCPNTPHQMQQEESQMQCRKAAWLLTSCI